MPKIEYSIIVCVDRNNGIGKNNKIPWYLPDDLRHFKKLTVKNVVIMGRKTWESLPDKFKPLPNRINVIITRNPRELESSVTKMNISESRKKTIKIESSFQKAIKRGYKYFSKEIFIIGGASVYRQALSRPYCSKLIISKINENHDCDVFFQDYKDTWRKDETIFENEKLSISIFKKPSYPRSTTQNSLLAKEKGFFPHSKSNISQKSGLEVYISNPETLYNDVNLKEKNLSNNGNKSKISSKSSSQGLQTGKWNSQLLKKYIIS